MPRPHGKYAVVSTTNPEAFAQCDRCGFWYNRSELVFQTQWAGQQIFSTGALVCYDRCFDTPNEQLRTIILPPDPPPIENARPPDFVTAETGPVQSTLTEDVLAGESELPVESTSGFASGDQVWVQLANAYFFLGTILSVGGDALLLTRPIPYVAPYTGVVSVAGTGTALDNYITENGLSIYVTEDGDDYVTESSA